MLKTCECNRIVLTFVPCTGEKCKTCKVGGHAPQQWCPDCRTFTCPCYSKEVNHA